MQMIPSSAGPCELLHWNWIELVVQNQRSIRNLSKENTWAVDIRIRPKWPCTRSDSLRCQRRLWHGHLGDRITWNLVASFSARNGSNIKSFSSRYRTKMTSKNNGRGAQVFEGCRREAIYTHLVLQMQGWNGSPLQPIGSPCIRLAEKGCYDKTILSVPFQVSCIARDVTWQVFAWSLASSFIKETWFGQSSRSTSDCRSADLTIQKHRTKIYKDPLQSTFPVDHMSFWTCHNCNTSLTPCESKDPDSDLPFLPFPPGVTSG